MKTRIINFLIALCLLSSYKTIAQKYDCGSTGANPYTVIAKSGLSMRVSPDLYAEKVQAVPFGKEVMVCDFYWETGLDSEIEGVPGKWVKAFYKGKSGYMFNGFLKKEATVQFIFSEWGPEDYHAYAGNNWTAIYPTATNELHQNFEAVSCAATSDTLLTPDGDDLPVSYPQYDESALFLVAGIENVNADNLVGQAFSSKFVMPGEQIEYFANGAANLLYAKGNLIANKDRNTLKAFTGIRNYELRIKVKKDGKVADRVIFESSMVDLNEHITPHGGMDLRWMGDLDSDGQADLILQVQDDMCSEYMLFLSSKAEPGYLLKQVSRYMVCDGC
ncbi:MAG: SH3 domain-containing protein [Bacteroidota bacterium]